MGKLDILQSILGLIFELVQNFVALFKKPDDPTSSDT